VPELTIRHDESIESGDRVLRIIQELADERPDGPPGDSGES
jgi:ribosome-binding factor A